MDEYLYHQPIHKDFHGILSLIFDYLKEKYGSGDTEDIFRHAAKRMYAPLIRHIMLTDLKAMERHIAQLMEIEGGEHTSRWEDGKLIVEIIKCPAIQHMEEKGQHISDGFCHLSTEVVNETMAEEGGYRFRVDFDQNAGKCTQVFWREEK